MRRILLATALAGSFGAPAGAQDTPGTITTHATARTRLPNTVADISLGIEAHATTVAGLHKALADGSGPLLAYLRGAGAERVRTEQVTVTPDTETDRGRGLPDRITGYTGRVGVAFRVAAEKLPEVLGGALSKGSNTVDGTVLSPRESEVEAARQQLAADAVRTALAQAARVAEAAARQTGAVRQILVDPGLGLQPRPGVMFASRMAVAGAPIATEAGDSEVTATVTVIVALIEP
ncbi:MAG: hypothetical protein NVSMB18_22500 [Acetobacteraceae bacterium]